MCRLCRRIQLLLQDNEADGDGVWDMAIASIIAQQMHFGATIFRHSNNLTQETKRRKAIEALGFSTISFRVDTTDCLHLHWVNILMGKEDSLPIRLHSFICPFEFMTNNPFRQVGIFLGTIWDCNTNIYLSMYTYGYVGVCTGKNFNEVRKRMKGTEKD